MKTLTYGSLKIQIDLDEKGEEILEEQIKESITMALKDFKWRSQHPQTPSSLIETQEEGAIHPKEKKKSKNRKAKK